jgi:hypothetical protein
MAHDTTGDYRCWRGGCGAGANQVVELTVRRRAANEVALRARLRFERRK